MKTPKKKVKKIVNAWMYIWDDGQKDVGFERIPAVDRDGLKLKEVKVEIHIPQ